MRVPLILLLLCSMIAANAIELQKGSTTHYFTFEEMLSWPQATIETQREKKGELHAEVWQGPRVSAILQHFGLDASSTIKFTADDNYLVRLSRQQLLQNDPIIAVMKNGEQLAAEKIRLIVPHIRDMYWIQNIAHIQLEESEIPTMPRKVYLAAPVLSAKPVRTELAPFTEVQGYYLNDLTSAVFPALSGEFICIGRDGVSHTLDYTTYLQQAVLVQDGDSFHLQSPSMPGGMWIKNIAYIQFFDRALCFTAEFKNWKAVATLTGWSDLAQQINAVSGDEETTIPARTALSDDAWQNVDYIRLP